MLMRLEKKGPRAKLTPPISTAEKHSAKALTSLFSKFL